MYMYVKSDSDLLVFSPVDIDCIMHVNPKLEKRGLAMVFNPTSTTLSRKLILPLYYTGISTEAMILHEGVMPGEHHVLC